MMISQRIAACALGSGLLLFGQTMEAAQWQEIKGKHFIVYFVGNGDRNAARTLLRKAEHYYRKIGSHIGYTRYSDFWTWEDRVKIYMFPTQESYVQGTGQPVWSTGYAARDEQLLHSRRIVTYNQQENFFDGLLPHEVSHLILHDFLQLSNIPIWFDEGIAQLQEDHKSQMADRIMRTVVREGLALPISSLYSLDIRKEEDPSIVNIFYAQSLSMIEFLINEYGSSAFGRFCRLIRDGSSFDEALRQAYTNKINSLQEWEIKWLKYMQSL